MRILLFLFMLSITLTHALAQDHTLENDQGNEFYKYYPENALYKKLKVKSALDTFAYSHSPSKEEYDAFGRKIAEYDIADTVKTIYTYLKNGDTLTRYHLSSVKGIKKEIYRYEKFIYNTAGKIISYQDCDSNPLKDNLSESEIDNFAYDTIGRLISVSIYFTRKYPQPFSKDIVINKSSLRLYNTYAYESDSMSRIILKKQITGDSSHRAIDSFFYDSKNRLIKSVEHQDAGYAGELAVLNLTNTVLINYEQNKKTIYSHSTYGQGGSDIQNDGEETDEYVYDAHGLTKWWFHKSKNEALLLTGYFVYEYYPSKKQ